MSTCEKIMMEEERNVQHPPSTVFTRTTLNPPDAQWDPRDRSTGCAPH